ncbi:hypothetical protein T459_01630 [Capsicum annuum]|uniref:Uncharacterized protein n=1 Tax=Capsicum annuum TaxID=4072 RepID=A0A2G3AHT1_CAPAN|nr:hypothetical protein FXO37_08806 [Capsicum annuum]PHT93748.1 hypothetical protein T459_01630 [Capsicum annuum]
MRATLPAEGLTLSSSPSIKKLHSRRRLRYFSARLGLIHLIRVFLPARVNEISSCRRGLIHSCLYPWHGTDTLLAGVTGWTPIYSESGLKQIEIYNNRLKVREFNFAPVILRPDQFASRRWLCNNRLKCAEMVLFRDYISSLSKNKYLLIEADDGMISTRLSTDTPIVDKYVNSWPPLQNSFHMSDWTSEHDIDANRPTKVLPIALYYQVSILSSITISKANMAKGRLRCIGTSIRLKSKFETSSITNISFSGGTNGTPKREDTFSTSQPEAVKRFSKSRCPQRLDVVPKEENNNIIPHDKEKLGTSLFKKIFTSVYFANSIDPTFLEALPEDLQAEVLASQQAQAQPLTYTAPTAEDIDPEFLVALPSDIQEKVLAQQRAQRVV